MATLFHTRINIYSKLLFIILLIKINDILAAHLPNFDLSSITLNPQQTGITITGKPNDQLGWAVSSAGDINNDGYDDILVASHFRDAYKGIVYVFYGGPTSSFEDISTSTLIPDPEKGFTIKGNAANDYFGFSASTAGDVNNDGYDDIIVGAYKKSGEKGAVYVIYGNDKSSLSDIDLSVVDLHSQGKGFTITGNAGGDYFGYSVSTAGDINGDEYSDIIIGAPTKGPNQGAVYVIYGNQENLLGNIDLSAVTLNPGTTGFTLTGESSGDSFGWSVSTAGNVNNDDYDDIVIGTSTVSM